MAASGYGLVSIIYYINILYLGVQIRYFYTIKRFFRHYRENIRESGTLRRKSSRTWAYS
jgi:hypothetical protein